MAIWFELGIFALAFVFAWWQFRDLRLEREKREKREKRESSNSSEIRQRALPDAPSPPGKQP